MFKLIESNIESAVKILASISFLLLLTSCDAPSTRPSIQGPGSSKALSLPDLQGEWETSGGDSVICNQQVHVLDYWEYYVSSESKGDYKKYDLENQKTNFKVYLKERYTNSEKFFLNPDFKTLKADQIIKEVISDLWKASPLFADQVAEAYDKSDISSWRTKESLVEIEDSTPIVKLPEACKLVQLVSRLTKDIESKVPIVEYYYNKKIFDSISEIQKAVIALHEVIYLIAKKDRHQNSDNIRRFVAFLFSTDFSIYADKRIPKSMLIMPNERKLEERVLERANSYIKSEQGSLFLVFRQILSYPFGDYMKFFIGESSFVESKNEYFYSLISLMKKLRTAKSECLDSGKKPNECLGLVHASEEVLSSFKPAEALLYFARFHHDFYSGGSEFSSEYLSSINEDFKSRIGFEPNSYIKDLCLSINKKDRPKFITITETAKDQCLKEGFQVQKAEDRPRWTNYNCFSSDQEIRIIHKNPLNKGDQSSVWLSSEVNNNGVGVYPLYKGSFKISNVVEKKIIRSFPYDSKEFYASLDFTLQITGAENEDQKELVFSFLKKSKLDLKMTSSGVEVLKNKAISFLKSKTGFEVKIPVEDCEIRESKLQESVFYH